MGSGLRAALYIRVSTEEQAAEGQSADAQTEVLTQYCSLYNIEIYKIYKDLGISGKETYNRPGLINMLHDAKLGCFNMVLVWKISRLSRSLKDLLQIIDELEKSKVTFSSYSEKFDTSTAVGKMTLQLLGSIAEFERNTIIDNVKLGLEEFARKGGKTGIVLGYDNINKQLVINPAEAEIVKMIFKLYTTNKMSMADIAAYLNKMGFRTKRNNKFSKDSIAVILSNPVYIGINRHKIGSPEEYQTKGSHLPIVDVDIWNEAQRLRESNKRKRPYRSGISSFLLSGKIKCCGCGSSMYGSSSRAGAKTYRYYRCKTCGFTCNADQIEEAVLKHLKDLFSNMDLIQKLLDESILLPSPSNNIAKKDLLQKEFNRTQKLLDKYIYLMSKEDFNSSEIIYERIKDLEKRLEELQKEIKDMQALRDYHGIPDSYTNIMKDLFTEFDRKKLKNVIDVIIESIQLSSKKCVKDIDINLNLMKKLH